MTKDIKYCEDCLHGDMRTNSCLIYFQEVKPQTPIGRYIARPIKQYLSLNIARAHCGLKNPKHYRNVND